MSTTRAVPGRSLPGRSVAASARRLDIDAALTDVTRRLVRRFSPRLPAWVVEETVRSCAARWQDAPVKEFVPLFVERRSIEQLRELSAEGLSRVA